MDIYKINVCRAERLSDFVEIGVTNGLMNDYNEDLSINQKIRDLLFGRVLKVALV